MSDTLYVKATGTEQKGKMVAVASDESIDRHGEKISIDGWDLKNFKKNPVLQWAHDYNIPPIGRANALRIDGKKLKFEPEFHEETELSKQIKTLFEKGYLKAFSVGFIPKEMEDANINSAELLEISAVPVPSNPNALIFAKKKGFTELAEWMEQFKVAVKKKDIKKKEIKKKKSKKVIALETEIKRLTDENNDLKNQITKGREKEQEKEKIMKKALQKIARNTSWALSKSKKGD